MIPRKLPSVICARSDRTTLVTAVDGESRTRTDPADVATVSASRSTLWMVPRMCSVFVVGEVLPPDAWSEEEFKRRDAEVWDLRVATLGAEGAAKRSPDDGKRSPVETY